MHELIIRGGTVVDGIGAPPPAADIAIDEQRISEVGRLGAQGTRTIEADGLLVTPGWADIHTHYDGQTTWDPVLAPSSWHGVTTLVMGNRGVGFAPARPDRHDWLIGLMEGVEDNPGAALSEGLTDRGTIEPGALGDLNLIDYDALALTGPYVAADLPAGGTRLLQKAEGSVATVKTGTITFEAGEATGELLGRLLRGSR